MLTPYDTKLPPHLQALREEIEGYARGYGLDFFNTIFEVIDADDLNEIASYGGFPTRYPHWTFGMAYEEMRKSYEYGLSKIYELVINNDPSYAYLMRSNHDMDQKLVMSHVFGHVDFFKHNAYFAHTNRKMMDEMANHGTRIRSFVEKYGEDEVENFLDKCMSIDDLIDVHSTAIRRRPEVARYDFGPESEHPSVVPVTRFKSKTYMDDYINPREVLKKEEEEHRKQREETARSFPEQPEKDILQFLLEYAPLKGWQRDILSIVRDEAYYFAPQGQTKILNEGWACICAGSIVPTQAGFLPIQQIVELRQAIELHDGQACQQVYDWAKFENRETVTIRTRRGLTLSGSRTHRVRLPDGTWRRLDEVGLGDRVEIACGSDVWAMESVTIDWQPKRRGSLRTVAANAGVSYSLLSYRRYESVAPPTDTLSVALAEYDAQAIGTTYSQNRRKTIRVPVVVDERFGAFLGYLTGDGHISTVKRVIGLTTGDGEQGDAFAGLARDLFCIEPRIRQDGNRMRVLLSSADLRDLLLHLGLETGPCARRKTIPECILRSPKSVVAAFLRALYDCDGYAGKEGVILSTSSDRMSELVQIVLLNFGILSRRRKMKDGCWHVRTTGKSAQVFQREINFGLTRKRESLDRYVTGRRWFNAERYDDEIVTIEYGQADVYDISVEGTHRYVAQGFVNHNSYWHSTIMTQKVLAPSEVIDYADHHSGTMAMSGGRLNPYKIGIELLRDVEFRWNTGRFGKDFDECDDLERKRTWDRQLGLGRQKIFEVRRIHNDVTFIDTFLTPEFCIQHRLFTFAWQEQAGQYYIESRDFAKIKERLLFSLTNHGRPWIYVVDGNFRNRGELLLRHTYNGVDLRLDYAQEVLTNLQFIWGRPVHLHTLNDNKPTLLSFDGADHSIKTGGDIDDPRRHTPPKTR